MRAQKEELRRIFRRERADSFHNKSFTHIVEAPEFLDAKCVTSYFSINDEPSTHELNQLLLARGITVLLPRVENKNLAWIPWNGEKDSLLEHRGLLEPIGQAISDISAIDVVIVPGLHIDRFGYRLGQGGGFYDRALPNLPGWKIGIVYSGEFGDDEIPREDHDFRLDAVATPEEIYRFN